MGADEAAVLAGHARRGSRAADEVATFFNGGAPGRARRRTSSERPGAAWFHRGAAKVVFDFTVVDGRVQGITFRAAPEVLASVVRRDGASDARG